jgi:hypothetical protein
MSQYQVINAVGITLRELLWSEMESDPTISSLIDEQHIVLRLPINLSVRQSLKPIGFHFFFIESWRIVT